jgi:hypothetical protein
MLHDILTFSVNIFIYTAVLCIWIAIIFAVFKIKPNRYLPFGWIEVVFNKLIRPLGVKIGKGLWYLSKVFFKWLIFTLEQLWYFLVESIRKLFDLMRNPNDS